MGRLSEVALSSPRRSDFWAFAWSAASIYYFTLIHKLVGKLWNLSSMKLRLSIIMKFRVNNARKENWELFGFSCNNLIGASRKNCLSLEDINLCNAHAMLTIYDRWSFSQLVHFYHSLWSSSFLLINCIICLQLSFHRLELLSGVGLIFAQVNRVYSALRFSFCSGFEKV